MLKAVLSFLGLGGEPSEAEMLTLETIPVGGVVMILGDAYVVEQKLTYIENGFSWYDYRLKTIADGRGYWLSVEIDDHIDVRLYTTINNAELSADKHVSYEGRSYQQEDQGSCVCMIEREGQAVRDTHEVGYFEYRSTELQPSDKKAFLSALKWSDTDIEWAHGHALTPEAVDILGRDTRSAELS